MQNFSNFIANALGLLQFSKSSTWWKGLLANEIWHNASSFMFNYVSTNFTHIFRGCFTSTGAIVGNYWSEPDQPGLINHRNVLRTDNISTPNKTQQSQEHILQDTQYCLDVSWISIIISVIVFLQSWFPSLFPHTMTACGCHMSDLSNYPTHPWVLLPVGDPWDHQSWSQESVRLRNEDFQGYLADMLFQMHLQILQSLQNIMIMFQKYGVCSREIIPESCKKNSLNGICVKKSWQQKNMEICYLLWHKSVIFKIVNELISWVIAVDLLLGEYHQSPMRISQEWFR